MFSSRNPFEYNGYTLPSPDLLHNVHENKGRLLRKHFHFPPSLDLNGLGKSKLYLLLADIPVSLFACSLRQKMER
jgi:hypothetical protein